MIALSQRSQNVTPSSTLAITTKINALIADSVDVVKTKWTKRLQFPAMRVYLQKRAKDCECIRFILMRQYRAI